MRPGCLAGMLPVMSTVNILICTWAGDDPAHLAAALDSLLTQTRPADEIILVEDGPLGPALHSVIREAGTRGKVTQVTLDENRGLIAALNEGLRSCQCTYVLRMDADDIAKPARIERQVDFMEAHPDIGVVGSAMQEFVDDPTNPLREKPVRQDHDKIRRQLPWRNPINHPTVCMRRESIPTSGYPELKYLEDYFLWSMMIDQGVRFANIPEPLVLYRFDDATLARRSGWTNFRNEVALRWWMFRHRLVDPISLLFIICLQALLRFSPKALQRAMWQGARKQL